MSLSIQIDKVISVLLADKEWYNCLWRENKSTFEIDSYEFLEGRHVVVVGGGTVVDVPSAGASWLMPGKGRISCPLTAILAVREG